MYLRKYNAFTFRGIAKFSNVMAVIVNIPIHLLFYNKRKKIWLFFFFTNVIVYLCNLL